MLSGFADKGKKKALRTRLFCECFVTFLSEPTLAKVDSGCDTLGFLQREGLHTISTYPLIPSEINRLRSLMPNEALYLLL